VSRPPRLPVWIAGGVLVKVLLYLLAVQLAAARGASPALYVVEGDVDYMARAEALASRGEYASGTRALDPAHRMPGYVFPFVPLRWVVGPETARWFQVLFQVVLGGVAAALVARLAFLASPRRGVFLTAWAIAAFYAGASLANRHLLPDGLAASVLVCVAWLLSDGKVTTGRALGAGLLFAWAVFLRPFLLPLGALGAVALTARGGWRSATWKTRAGPVIAFLAPFLVADATWTVRNYVRLGKPIAFQTAGFLFEPTWLAFRDLAESVGADFIWWQPETLGGWFTADPDRWRGIPPPAPAALWSDECSRADLERARDLFARRRSTPPGPDETLPAEAQEILNRCRAAYEREHPWDHQVLARGRLAVRFLVHAGPMLPSPPLRESPPWLAALRIGMLGLHLLVMLVGVPSAVALALSRRGPPAWLLAGVPLYILAFFPLVVRWVELRYAISAYPFLCGTAAIGLCWLFEPAWEWIQVRAPGSRVVSPGKSSNSKL
jgi:hypothetical protein